LVALPLRPLRQRDFAMLYSARCSHYEPNVVFCITYVK
jgi:hypothetical protein